MTYSGWRVLKRSVESIFIAESVTHGQDGAALWRRWAAGVSAPDFPMEGCPGAPLLGPCRAVAGQAMDRREWTALPGARKIHRV